MELAERVATAFKARQLEARVETLTVYWGGYVRLPTVVLGAYLGHGEVTVSGELCRWLCHDGTWNYALATDPGAVVSAVIRDRAGLGI